MTKEQHEQYTKTHHHIVCSSYRPTQPAETCKFCQGVNGYWARLPAPPEVYEELEYEKESRT